MQLQRSDMLTSPASRFRPEAPAVSEDYLLLMSEDAEILPISDHSRQKEERAVLPQKLAFILYFPGGSS